MKSVFVSKLKINDKLQDEPFLVRELSQGTARSGGIYLRISLADKSGQVNGVYWDVPAQTLSWVRVGQIVLVDGKISTYRESPQVVISGLTLHESPNMEDFLLSSERSESEMVAELREKIASLGEPYQRLTSHILLDDDFLPKFASAPAAKRMHHAYMGGLLAHILSMAQLAEIMVNHYEGINRDLLLCGVLLHDMGKAMEYDMGAGIFITDDGHLVGHITRAIVIIEKAADQVEISTEIVRQIVHLIASHHGKLEWGSPVPPKTLEAVVLHQLDLLDSRVQGFFDFMREDAGNNQWSQNVSPMFGTYLRRTP